MFLFSQVTTTDDYVGHLLPGLLVLGTAMGLIFPTSVSAATLGVRREDAGVASALVNTTQQVGSAIAVAVFNSVATTAAADYLAAHLPPTPAVLADAAVHSYAIVFASASVIFLIGAVVTALLNRSGVPGAVAADGAGESSLPEAVEPGTIVA